MNQRRTIRAYLDYNATAPLRPEAMSAMGAAMEVFGNPSSVHDEGRRARGLVEFAREAVAALVGAEASEVVFTSGATEANAAVMAAGWDVIIVAGIEHDSVLAPARAAGAEIVGLPVLPTGIVDLAKLEAALAAKAGHGRKILLTLQLANNETGVIQPVAAAAALARAHGVTIHSDAVQAVGRVPVALRALGVDLMSLTAHKLGGPKGVGALVVRDGTHVPPFIVGGGQERRRRAGTENVIGIAGFAAAAEAARCELDRFEDVARLRDRLEGGVRRLTPQVAIIGSDAPRLPNTSCLAWSGQSAETLVIKLDLAGIAASAGAACSSGKVGASAVLSAMGLGSGLARSAIRLSFGWRSSEADLESFLSAWEGIATSVASRRAVA